MIIRNILQNSQGLRRGFGPWQEDLRVTFVYLLPSVLSLIRGLACSKLSAHLALVLSHNDVPFSAGEHLSGDKASVATVLPAPSCALIGDILSAIRNASKSVQGFGAGVFSVG